MVLSHSTPTLSTFLVSLAKVRSSGSGGMLTRKALSVLGRAGCAMCKELLVARARGGNGAAPLRLD